MKKTLLYSFLPCLMAMLMCTTFTACSDDDDDSNAPLPITESSIIGKWERGPITLRFFENGKALRITGDLITDASELYWWIDEGMLYLGDRIYSGHDATLVYHIVSITNSELTLEETTYNWSEGYKVFKRGE